MRSNSTVRNTSLSNFAYSRSCLIVFAFLFVGFVQSSRCFAQSIPTPPSRPDDLPRTAHWMRALSNDGCNTFRDGRTLWLIPTDGALRTRQCSIPRLCASLTSVGWNHKTELAIKFKPEPERWDFSWQKPPAGNTRIKVVFETEPKLPNQITPARPAADGSIMLHANQAMTLGDKLRFEPQSFKNTVGYWTVPADYVTWSLKIDESGDYSVAILQGCGDGQGGSDALLSLRDDDLVVSELPFRPIDTGNFHNFRWNHLGQISVKQSGTYQLRIHATRIAKAALWQSVQFIW